MRDKEKIEQDQVTDKVILHTELLLDIRELLIEQKKIAISLLEHRGSIQITK